MSRRRVPLRLMVPVALLALVTALGYLQYRWVGQVSEAERAQLRESLDRRAHEFATDFDRDIGRAYQTFRLEPGFDPAAPDRIIRQFDDWRLASKFPGLIKTAYFASGTREGVALFRFSTDTRTFVPSDWPASLAVVRRHLEAIQRPAATGRPPTVMSVTMAPVLPDVPAIVIPEMPALPNAMAVTHVPATEQNVMVSLRTATKHIILELDREYIVGQMLPALVDQHFPATGREQYRVVILGGASTPLLSRGLTAADHLDPTDADARASFFGAMVEMINRVSTTGTSGERIAVFVEQRSAIETAVAVSSFGSGWTILLQHAAGSLDAAVAQARRRNLMLSFGILGVLMAGVGLIVVNARRSEKLAAQQMDFVSTVSHELRTPLAVIRSAAQNLAAGVVHDAGQARQYGDLIESEGRRLTDMVEQVLEYAGLSGNRRLPDTRPVDTGSIIKDVVLSCTPAAEASGVHIAVDVPTDLPLLQAEEHGIRRALHNLIGNALKYAAEGGWVGVAAARGAGRDAHEVLITVSDRGRGIAGEDLPHIFEPFYRGRYARDRQIHGNGLGLSLVKRIVEAHGGRVTVTSSPGQGTVFTMHLPAAPGPSGAQATSPVADGRPA